MAHFSRRHFQTIRHMTLLVLCGATVLMSAATPPGVSHSGSTTRDRADSDTQPQLSAYVRNEATTQTTNTSVTLNGHDNASNFSTGSEVLPQDESGVSGGDSLLSQNVTYVESSMGSVTVSAGVLSPCFRRNGTLAVIAVDTVVSLTQLHVGKTKNNHQSESGKGSESANQTSENELVHTNLTNQKSATDKSETGFTYRNLTDDRDKDGVQAEPNTTTRAKISDSNRTPSGNISDPANTDNSQTDLDSANMLSVGSTCTLKMEVPELTFTRVHVPERFLTLCLGSADVSDVQVRQRMYTFCGDVTVSVSTGEAGDVRLTMEVEGGDWVKFRVSGGLLMLLQSAVMGSIQQSPQSAPYSAARDRWAMLRVPAHHSLMLSLQRHVINHGPQRHVCRSAADRPFLVYHGNTTSVLPQRTSLEHSTSSADVSWTSSAGNGSSTERPAVDYFRSLDCEDEASFPHVFHSGIVLIQYKSDLNHTAVEHDSSTVSLLFSFHQTSHVLEQLADGTWNCSVPHWLHFQQHFPCDLEGQCLNGEDEEGCVYSTNHCRPGSLTGNGSCYFLVTPGYDLTWLKANEACAARDGHVFSLNSPQEEDDVGDLLKFRPWMTVAYVGLQNAGSNLPAMYRQSWLWSDGTVANYLNITPQQGRTCAAACHHDDALTTVHCTQPYHALILCEVNRGADASQAPVLQPVSPWVWAEHEGGTPHSFVQCPLRHMTHTFLACDMASACFGQDYAKCHAPLTPLPPMFKCTCAEERIPYSLVCDHQVDCQDGSDEDFCQFRPCKGALWFRCTSHEQCVPRDSLCDGQYHCNDGSDEGSQCETPIPTSTNTITNPSPPLFLLLNRRGLLRTDHNLSLQLSQGTLPCPNTHFTCSLSSGDCLPLFLRCNGVHDCPGKEDEAGCGSLPCPGLYRCRGSSVCLHPEHLCDGLFQCPQKDDEVVCGLSCPEGCTCYGLSWTCQQRPEVWRYPNLRFLDAAGSGMTLQNVSGSWYLVDLSLARCGIEDIFPAVLPNLRVLDLSDNDLKEVPGESFINIKNLRSLSLAGNPLQLLLKESSPAPRDFVSLRSLDLSRVQVTELGDDTLTSLTGSDVEVLNLTGCGVEAVKGTFSGLRKLQVLDLRGCPMTRFPTRVFRDLAKLNSLYTDNYKLCCQGVLPFGFDTSGCVAPDNDLSSCESLLKSNYFRLVVYLLGVMSVLGNALSMGYRVCVNRRDSTQTASVFVTHLCVANFLTGLYLVMIAAADWNTRGSYVWEDTDWRHGVACKVAGFLLVMSSEVSVLLVCLMTADRYLVLRCPLSGLNFKKWSAHTASLCSWALSFVLAVIPLMSVTKGWQFYSRTALCVPLPISDTEYPGYGYCFLLFNVSKLVLFVFVTPAQALVYLAIRDTRHAIIADKSKKSMDLIVARRLVVIVMTDFLSWFPVALLGLLNATGTVVTGEVQVILAIFVLPLNSALNPFLYTISMARDLKKSRTREKIREDVLSQARQARLQANETRAVSFATRV